MTQYIADILKDLQQKISEVLSKIEALTPPEDADCVYVDKTRGGEDDHNGQDIPPYTTNDT